MPRIHRHALTALLGLIVFSAAFIPLAAQAHSCSPDITSSATQPVPRNDDWWQKKFDELVAEVPKQHGKVLIIGDSLAAKWPASLPWPESKDTGIFRYAIGGDHTEHILWRLSRLPIEQMAPSTVVLIAGTNNLSTATEACPVFAGIYKIISELRRRVPQAHLVVIDVLPRGPDFNYKPEMIAEINANILERRKQDGYDAIDAKEKLLTASGGRNPSPLYEDAVHLSPAGYALLAEAVMEQVRAPKPH